MKVFITAIILIMAPSLLSGHQTVEERRLKKEYRRLLLEREYLEADYWNKRKHFINRKQSAASTFKKYEKKYDVLIQKRNNMREERLKIQLKIENNKQELDKLKLHIETINQSYLEILKELRGYIRFNFPMTDIKHLRTIDLLKKRVRTGGSNFAANGKRIMKLIFTLLRESARHTLSFGNVLTGRNQLCKAWKLKLGNVYYAYVTRDLKHAGILLNSSKSTVKRFVWFEKLSSSLREQLVTGISTLVKLKKNKGFQPGTISLPMDVLLSKAVRRRYAAAGKNIFQKFGQFFSEGGFIMYPLFLMAIFAVFIIFERSLFYRRNHTDEDALMQKILPLLREKKPDMARVNSHIDKAKGPITRMLSMLLNNLKATRDEAINVFQESILHEVPVFEKRLATLKIFGVVAPLLGLLGTVSGMISLFDVITIYGTKDPKLLAGGISEALITTETGLIIAVPIILAHRFLLNRVNHILLDMERYGMSLLNILWKGRKE